MPELATADAPPSRSTAWSPLSIALLNGAYFWRLFHDTEDPVRRVETFMDESSVEHLRQHERVRVANRAIQANAKQYLQEGATVHPSHWLGEREA